MFNLNEFKTRRHQLIKAMGDGIAIIPTSPELIRNRDSHYPYRFDSYFYYLTGFKEPEALLVLVAGEDSKSILFCRDKDIEREIWDGFRYGPDAAKHEFGFDQAYSFNTLDELMPKLLENQPKLFYSLGADVAWDARVTSWLNQVKAQARSGVSAPDGVVDVRKLVDEMRLYKSSYELDLMRQSAKIASRAHRAPCIMCVRVKWSMRWRQSFSMNFIALAHRPQLIPASWQEGRMPALCTTTPIMVY